MRKLRFLFLFIGIFLLTKNLSGQVCIVLSSAPGTDAQTVCQGTPIVQIRYTLAASVTGASVTGLPPGVTGTYSAGLYTIDGAPLISGAFDYTVTVISTGGCTGSGKASGKITVNSIPGSNLTSSDPDNIFCAGTPVTFTATPGAANYNFRVNFVTVQNGSSNLYTTSSLTNGQVVDVIVTGSNGCIVISNSISNIVNPVPTATASNNGPVCPGTELDLLGGPSSMIAYTWSGPNGFSSGMQNPVVSKSATPAMGGTYTLVVTNSFGCQNTTTTTATVRPLPSVTAANNSPVCVAAPLLLIGGPTGMSSYSWTGPNGFTSDQRSIQVSASATLAMAGTYTLTVTDSYGCINSASTNVIVNALPVPTASNNGPVCIGTLLTLTGGPSGMSSYSWTGPNGFTSVLQSPLVSATATAAMAGTYTLTVTSSTGCVNSTATTVVVNSLPVATASNNGPVCEGRQLTLSGGPSGLSSYEWIGPNGFTSIQQNPVVSSSATAAMAGLYTLTVTNSNGCKGSAITNVIINPLPVPTASNNGPVCAGAPLILAGGPSGMTSYSWTGPNGFVSPSQSPTVSLTATTAMSGTYTLTVVNANGCSNSVSTTAVVNPLPIPQASNNGPVCAGATLTLTGGPDGMASYLWTGPNGFSSVLQNPVVSTSATAVMAGAYTLTVINGTGCRASAITNVIVNQAPVATATSNSPVCVGSALTLTGGPASMLSYGWTGPDAFTSNLPNPLVSASATTSMAGVYILTVTALGGCRDTASTRVSVFTVPVANGGPGGVVCDTNFVFQAIPSVGIGTWTVVTGPGTARFTPNANSPTATVTVSEYGTYSFRWTERNGPCESSSVVTVNFYQPPEADAGTGGDECDLDFILGAMPSTGTGSWSMISGTGTATFVPDVHASNATVTVSEYGTKIFRWIESNGICSDSAFVTVNFYQQPVSNAGPGGNNCGLEYNLRAVPSVGIGTWTRVSGPGSVAFSPNANSPTARAIVSAFGTHVFRWTEVNGTCTSSSTASVNFIPQPQAIGGNGGDECDLDFKLNATPPQSGTGTWSKVSGPGIVTFTPDANHADATVTVTQFGAYDLAWTVVNSLCNSTDIIRVTFHDLPSVSAGEDVAICGGRSIQLNATGTGTFLWSPASLLNNPAISNPLATPTVTTDFTVLLTDQWGCKNSDQVNVEVRPQPVSDAGADQELAFLFETTLDATPPVSGQEGEWTLLEGAGELSDVNNYNTTVSDLDLGINSFIWTVSNGVCPISADTVYVTVHDLNIPTLITPNQDSKNDYFVIEGIETFGKTSLMVFNRWGGLVYQKDNYDNKWNGVDDQENDLPEDTYFYILKTEKSRIIKGYIVIRR
jgi:gliding motility-associated-like protein